MKINLREMDSKKLQRNIHYKSTGRYRKGEKLKNGVIT
jgi:hypothetical protein